MPIDDKTPNWRHTVTIVERGELTVDGVVNLGSYDEHEVVMETEQGILTVKGVNLNIKQLNLDKGNIVVDGNIQGLSYQDEANVKKGLLQRLLK